MAIRFKCKKCGQELNVRDELAGKQGKCPKCQSILNVPAPTTTAARAPAAARPAAPAKKKVEEVIEGDVIEDEDEVAEVEVVEDESPRKGKGKTTSADDFNFDDDDPPPKKSKSSSRRRDDDDDEDEDDRPRKKKRRDDDDEDDDDRPRSKRRRDDDDDDDEEDDRRKQSPKKRRAAFRRAGLGVQLTSIGSFVYAGALVLSLLSFVITMLAVQSAMKNAMRGGRGGGEGMETILTIIGWLIVLGFFAAAVLHVVGAAFTITTPARNGAMGLSIATVATAGLSLMFFLWLSIEILNATAAAGFTVGLVSLNPFAGIRSGAGGMGIGMGPRGSLGAVLFLLPLAELGRITCFALYLWAVGKSLKDRDTAKSGLMLGVIAPSTCAGVGLVVWILTTSIKTQSMGAGIAIFSVYLLAYAGVIGYYGFATMSAKETVESGR